MPSVRSGVRCYVAFVGTHLDCLCRAHAHFVFTADATCGEVKCYFPPRLEWLLAWSTLFRSEGTLGNYLGYVKTGCLVVKAPVKVVDVTVACHSVVLSFVCAMQVFDHPALQRAKAATAKRMNFSKRPRMWIQR